MAQPDPVQPFSLADDDGGHEVRPIPEPQPRGVPIDLPPGPPGESHAERMRRAVAFVRASQAAEAAGLPPLMADVEAMYIHPTVQAAVEHCVAEGEALLSQRRVWSMVQGLAGAPSRAEVRAQVTAWQQRRLLTPPDDPAVTHARAEVTAAQQALATLEAEVVTAEAVMKELERTWGALQVQAAKGSVEAAAHIAAAEEAYTLAWKKCERLLPTALALATADLAAAELVLAGAITQRNRAACRQLPPVELVLAGQTGDALEAFLDALRPHLALYDVIDAAWERVGRTPGTPSLPPKKQFVAAVLRTLATALELPPAWLAGVPHVEGLTCVQDEPLEEADFDRLAGTALVTFRQDGRRNDLQLPGEDEFAKRNFSRGQWVTMPQPVYEALKARWGDLIVRKVRRSVWED